MTRKEERVKYAMSLQCKGMEDEEQKEIFRLAVLDGAVWADKTMIEKAAQWLASNVRCDGYTLQTKSKLISDFRKVMEE